MKQLRFVGHHPVFFDDQPQTLELHQLVWCQNVLSKYLTIEQADYYRLYPGSNEAVITVRHAGVLAHPRRDDILRHAADFWSPTNDGGIVTQIDDNTFHVSTFIED